MQHITANCTALALALETLPRPTLRSPTEVTPGPHISTSRFRDRNKSCLQAIGLPMESNNQYLSASINESYCKQFGRVSTHVDTSEVGWGALLILWNRGATFADRSDYHWCILVI